MKLDFRRIDDPSLQAQLAKAYELCEGVAGWATYRVFCNACGKMFYARMPTAKWCCEACARTGAKGRRRARSRARRERWRSCHRCGKAFQGRRADAKYCSNACRQAAYRVTRRGSVEINKPVSRNETEGHETLLPKGAAKGTEGGLP